MSVALVRTENADPYRAKVALIDSALLPVPGFVKELVGLVAEYALESSAVFTGDFRLRMKKPLKRGMEGYFRVGPEGHLFWQLIKRSGLGLGGLEDQGISPMERIDRSEQEPLPQAIVNPRVMQGAVSTAKNEAMNVQALCDSTAFVVANLCDGEEASSHVTLGDTELGSRVASFDFSPGHTTIPGTLDVGVGRSVLAFTYRLATEVTVVEIYQFTPLLAHPIQAASQQALTPMAAATPQNGGPDKVESHCTIV